jgi:hypothetical protein
MGAIKQRVNDIVNMLCEGYSTAEVADYYGEQLDYIEQIAIDYGIADDFDSEYDDSMDGDFDSAMASAGLGTDEDYGYYGDE